MTTAQPQPQPAPYYPPQPRHRPVGVTILAILEVLGGLGLLVLSLAFFALAALVGTTEFMNRLGPNVPQWILNTAPVLFAVLGLVILIFAIVAFIIAWGFLRGKRWAWFLGIVFAVLDIVGAVTSAFVTGTAFSIATVGFAVIIPVVILLYLLMPSTKAWFTE